MRKITVLLLVLAAAVAIPAQAQIKVGVKAGLNLGTVGGDGAADDLKTNPNFHGGAYATISAGDILSIQPELLFSVAGSVAENGGTDVTSNLNYLTIPIMVRYEAIAGLNIHAGPYIGLLLSASADDVDIADAFTGADFGIGFGVGYDLPFGLNVTARYNLGLSDINDIDGVTDANITNRVFQLSVGYDLFEL